MWYVIHLNLFRLIKIFFSQREAGVAEDGLYLFQGRGIHLNTSLGVHCYTCFGIYSLQ